MASVSSGPGPDPEAEAAPAGIDEDHFQVTAADGLKLAVRGFPTADGPVVILSHGIASHQGWYVGLSRQLRDRGVSVYTADRRGVGQSAGVRGHMRDWKAVVDDLHLVADEASHRLPDRPLHLLGISLGGVFSVAAALDRPGRYQSVAASTPGFASRVKLPLLRRLRVLRRALFNPTRQYDLPFGVEQLTDREDWRAVLDRDPDRNRRVSARFLVEMVRMQGSVKRRMGELTAPLLVLLAERDQLVDNDAVVAVIAAVRRTRARVERYQGAAHVLPAALAADALPGRLAEWFHTEHAAPGSGCEVIEVPHQEVEPSRMAPPPEIAGADS